jgi:metal-responsive CopG/Arc/MetJ family transcriptional regulator
MPARKRIDVDFDAAVYDALRERAAEQKMSISDIVNEAVRQALADYEQDAADHAIFEQRRNEPTIPFEDFVADMKRRGKL